MRKNRAPEGKCGSARLTATALILVIAFSIGVTSILPATASSEPGGTPLSDRFGVAESHLKLHDAATMDKELSETAEAGIGWIRIDFAWPDLEPQPGAWDFAGSDMAVEKARSRGIKILGILGGTPPWANGDKTMNVPPTDVEALKRYASTVSARYRARVSAWELWNEENTYSFWAPPNADAYVALMRPVASTIRAADPAATIVLGGIAGLDPSFLEGCLKAGAADFVDAIAYHPYPETLQFLNYTPQESNSRFIVDFIRWMLSKYTTKPIQIWITEVGWTTCTYFPPGVDEATQATNMLRSLINYAGTSADKVFWYCLWDEQQNPGYSEANYGLLSNSFARKPSWHYYKRFQESFGTAVSKSEGVVSFSCSRPGTLEAHAYELPDGSIAIAAWKSDDRADSLELTVLGKEYSDPLAVDLATGRASAVQEVMRGTDGNTVVSGLAVGKTPLILKVSNNSCRVASITPGRANQFTFYVSAELSGSGFQPGATVRLEKGGGSIQTWNVKVASASKLTCNLGFFLVDPGTYDAVVLNRDGSGGRLAGAVEVKHLWW